MTGLYAGLAVVIVVLLGIVTYYLVGTLKQLRRTAQAAEEFLLSARPRVEETSDNINGLIRRANGIVATVETGIAAFTPQRTGAMSTVMKAVTTASAVVSGAAQVARLFFNNRHASQENTQTTTQEESAHGESR